jgi:hypothetical protein
MIAERQGLFNNMATPTAPVLSIGQLGSGAGASDHSHRTSPGHPCRRVTVAIVRD